MEEAKKLKDQEVAQVKEIDEAEEVRKLTYKEVESLLMIVEKIATRNVKHRLEVAFRKRDLKYIMEPVNEAREIPEDTKMYNERHIALLKKYGTPMGGAGSYSVPSEKMSTLNEELSALDEEFREILDREEVRKRQADKLMTELVEFDIDPLKYEWLGDNVDSNDLTTLLELEFVELPDDGDEDEDDREGRRRKARNKRKGKKRR